MKLTMPQIIMIQHGSQINSKRMDARIEAGKKSEKKKAEQPPLINGKPIEEAASDDIRRMLALVNS